MIDTFGAIALGVLLLAACFVWILLAALLDWLRRRGGGGGGGLK